MADLARIVAQSGVPVSVVAGQVVATASGGLAVNLAGATPTVQWPGGYIPQAGDPVRVLLIGDTAVVLGPITATERPLIGTVSGAAAGGYVPVSTTAGTLQCRYAGTAPATSTVVFLDWQATTPRILSPGAVAATSADVVVPNAPAPPPPSPSSGTLTVPALDSATWNATYSSWSSYYGTKVLQGSWSSDALRGAWFYGSAPSRIAGKTITAARLRLGARLHVGSYSSTLDLQLYRHTSGTRPTGDVTRVAGPSAVTIAVDAAAGDVAIPTAWAQAIVDSGGGIGLSGGSYGGVYGVGDDPASGQLSLDWTN